MHDIDIVRLTDMKRGQRAVITQLTAYDEMRRRLQDIGLIKGTVVECLGKSPLGDPTVYLIRGAVMALRCEDSGHVLVQVKDEENVKKYYYGEELVKAMSCLEDEVWD